MSTAPAKVIVVLTPHFYAVSINYWNGAANIETCVDYRYYDTDGQPIIGVDGLGNPTHLCGLSSSASWAEHDAGQLHGWNGNQLRARYPDGWLIEFERREMTGRVYQPGESIDVIPPIVATAEPDQ